MGKSHWIFVAVAVLAAGACTQDFDEFFRGKAAPGGSGGTAGTGGSGGSGGTGGAVGGGGGAGGCESPSDCPGSDTTCRYRTCEQGQCGTEDAPLGTPCTEQGGELCDGNGNCVTAECTDNVKNGNETDVDCGGDSCPPCANGLECNVYGDCESRFCDTGGGGGSGGGTAGTCAPCGGDPDCLPVPSSW